MPEDWNNQDCGVLTLQVESLKGPRFLLGLSSYETERSGNRFMSWEDTLKLHKMAYEQ
jgi:hypothetical protein